MSQPQLLDTKTMDSMRTIVEQTDETPDSRYILEEYFEKKPAINGDMVIDPDADSDSALAAFVIANRSFEVLGTNAVTASVAWDSTNAGLLLSTAGADDDQVIIAPHLDTNQSAWQVIKWGTENQTEWTAAIKIGAAITTEAIWAGLKLTNTPVIATDADQVYFRYNTDDEYTTWHVISSINGTDTDTTTAVTVAVDTPYKFQIKIGADRTAKCYINDVLVYTTAALKNDIDLIPYVGLMSLDADTSVSTLILNYEKISRILFE